MLFSAFPQIALSRKSSSRVQNPQIVTDALSASTTALCASLHAVEASRGLFRRSGDPQIRERYSGRRWGACNRAVHTQKHAKIRSHSQHDAIHLIVAHSPMVWAGSRGSRRSRRASRGRRSGRRGWRGAAQELLVGVVDEHGDQVDDKQPCRQGNANMSRLWGREDSSVQKDEERTEQQRQQQLREEGELLLGLGDLLPSRRTWVHEWAWCPLVLVGGRRLCRSWGRRGWRQLDLAMLAAWAHFLPLRGGRSRRDAWALRLRWRKRPGLRLRRRDWGRWWRRVRARDGWFRSRLSEDRRGWHVMRSSRRHSRTARPRSVGRYDFDDDLAVDRLRAVSGCIRHVVWNPPHVVAARNLDRHANCDAAGVVHWALRRLVDRAHAGSGVSSKRMVRNKQESSGNAIRGSKRARTECCPGTGSGRGSSR